MKRFTRIARQTLRRPKLRFPGWQQKLIFIFLFLLLALVGLDFYLRMKIDSMAARPPSFNPKTLGRDERLSLEFDRILLQAGIEPAWIEAGKTIRRVRVPAGIDLHDLHQRLIACALQARAEVARPARNLPAGEKEFSCGFGGRIVDTIRLIPAPQAGPASGKIALVIDDFGYHDDEVIRQFLALPFAVTYAIIPGLPHSAALAQKLRRAGKAIIVHMPMEALERRVEQNGYELLVESPAQEIRRRVRKAIAAVPGAQGMNNHMGSRATQDQALLLAMFAELKEAGLFFLDSRTTPDTRAFALAQQHSLPAGLNDTFLDTVIDTDYVRQKLKYLAQVASASGSATGIGHPHRVTLRVLQESVPELQRRGFEMVTVKELLQRRARQYSTMVQEPAQ